MRRLALLAVIPLLLAGCAEPATPPTQDPPETQAELCVSTLDQAQEAAEPIWFLQTSMGDIRLTLFCDKTPITGQNVVDLTEQGYFDETKFHRVIDGFMNQGGDPLTRDESQRDNWGTGGPGYTIRDEFYCADGSVDHEMNNPQYPGRQMREGGPHQACDGQLGLTHHQAGMLSMANAGAGTGGSQFFITARDTPSLDGAHPVFGQVADEESLAVVLAINRVPTDVRDRPLTPVVIERATIVWT